MKSRHTLIGERGDNHLTSFTSDVLSFISKDCDGVWFCDLVCAFLFPAEIVASGQSSAVAGLDCVLHDANWMRSTQTSGVLSSLELFRLSITSVL